MGKSFKIAHWSDFSQHTAKFNLKSIEFFLLFSAGSVQTFKTIRCASFKAKKKNSGRRCFFLRLTLCVQMMSVGLGLAVKRHSKYTSSPSLMVSLLREKPRRSTTEGGSERQKKSRPEAKDPVRSSPSCVQFYLFLFKHDFYLIYYFFTLIILISFNVIFF